ncbi:MAG: aminotransferase class I/II-fold pyridoxal phosphate-dependent enzyme [Ruminococcaceae bacterium]|nr:aminotransferase class I/II-fold pyridoxal phosphate-dependent enzyme [Oscillospiraceae bacterium]
MTSYLKMSKEELKSEFETVKKEYARLTSMGFNLDMSRGKPGADQMDLSKRIFDLVGNDMGFKNKDGVDCRNYGGLDGLVELKDLFSEILGVSPAQIIVGGNSSLNMMYDTVAQAMTHGFGSEPWFKQGEIKFLCPAPGYDRHFAITEHFGIKMKSVPNTKDGPDMDIVEELVKDPAVKGMWCVPKYSNPEGITYSDKTVKRLAALKPAAKDFRIFWDNAYAIHDLYDEGDSLLNIYDECVKAGNPDLVIMFTSTSKITFPGAGVAAQGASPNNVQLLKSRMQFQTIGPDKLNQLRHARMFRGMNDLKAHMKEHANILRPKFESVLAELDKELEGLEIANWNRPKGGYFISLNVMNGCAKRVEELCAGAGMILTKVGATYPYGIDEKDSNIRVAPSYPPVEEIKKASIILCVSVRYAALEKLLNEK